MFFLEIYHHYDLSSATVALTSEYDPQKPGSFAIDNNKPSYGGECAVAESRYGSDIMIDMKSTVDIDEIQV